jgi:hypothetical protein
MKIERAAMNFRPDQRFLFVIGHGRSGTTLMQKALNSSVNIFLFAEANWQNFDLRAYGFAQWYNSMHRSFGNPPCKGDRCPEIEGSLPDVLDELGKSYHWIGDKVAFSDESLGYDRTKAWQFFFRWFPKAYYILMLRDADSVVQSAQNIFPQETAGIYVYSYLKSLLNITNYYLLFDNCIVVDFPRVDSTCFDAIGRWIGEDLSNAGGEWEVGRNEKKSSILDLEGIGDARYYYETLSSLIDPDTMKIKDRLNLRKIQRELYNRFDQGT